jgi:hypothetical protein
MPRLVERSKFFAVVYYMLNGGPSAALQQKRGGCRKGLVTTAALIGGYLAIAVIIQAIFFPWGRSFTGAPTLTGRWYGEGSTVTGKRLVLAVGITPTFWGPDDQGCMKGCDVQGTARLCGNGPSIQEYTFDGDVAGRSGRTFHLDLRKSGDTPYRLALASFRGEWEGGQTMRLIGRPYSDTAAPDGGDTASPILFRMQRGSENEFLAACRAANTP